MRWWMRFGVLHLFHRKQNRSLVEYAVIRRAKHSISDTDNHTFLPYFIIFGRESEIWRYFVRLNVMCFIVITSVVYVVACYIGVIRKPEMLFYEFQALWRVFFVVFGARVNHLPLLCQSIFGKSIQSTLVCMSDKMKNRLSLSYEYIYIYNIDSNQLCIWLLKFYFAFHFSNSFKLT